jgi:hypothetical protein
MKTFEEALNKAKEILEEYKGKDSLDIIFMHKRINREEYTFQFRNSDSEFYSTPYPIRNLEMEPIPCAAYQKIDGLWKRNDTLTEKVRDFFEIVHKEIEFISQPSIKESQEIRIQELWKEYLSFLAKKHPTVKPDITHHIWIRNIGKEV